MRVATVRLGRVRTESAFRRADPNLIRPIQQSLHLRIYRRFLMIQAALPNSGSRSIFRLELLSRHGFD